MPLTVMTGRFLDLRRAIRRGDLVTCRALLTNLPALRTWPDLRPDELAALRGWGLL